MWLGELTVPHDHRCLLGRKATKQTAPQQPINPYLKEKGAQWLSGRVLDSRLRGPGVRASPASLRCVLEQDAFILA